MRNLEAGGAPRGRMDQPLSRASQPITNLITNTTPVFFHAAGPLEASPLWPAVQAYVENHVVAVPGNRSARYTFLTWMGGPRDYWSARPSPLAKSLDALAVPFTAVGAEFENWKNTYKIPAMLTALRRVETPFVIATDASDVVVTGEPGAAVDVLERLSADVVYMGEDYFWPEEMTELRAAEDAIPNASSTQYPYLNSGVFVARTSAAIELFERAVHRLNGPVHDRFPNVGLRLENDQPLMKELYVQAYPRIQLDVRSEVFQLITRQTSRELHVPGHWRN